MRGQGFEGRRQAGGVHREVSRQPGFREARRRHRRGRVRENPQHRQVLLGEVRHGYCQAEGLPRLHQRYEHGDARRHGGSSSRRQQRHGVLRGRAEPAVRGDDTGFVPPAKSATAKCEGKVSKAAAKLVACIFKCHDSRGAGKLEDATHEEECETTDDSKSCRAKFIEAIGKLKECPACINATNMAGLEATAEAALDASNGMVYCASPSAAFVE
jgi:hypothetical protein